MYLFEFCFIAYHIGFQMAGWASTDNIAQSRTKLIFVLDFGIVLEWRNQSKGSLAERGPRHGTAVADSSPNIAGKMPEHPCPD